jgi:hypothetical protein
MTPRRHNHLRTVGTAILVLFLIPSIPLADDAVPRETPSGFAYPQGSPGEMAEAYIEAFNTGDEGVVAAFYTERESQAALDKQSIKTQLYQYRSLFAMMGKLTPHSVLDHENSMIVLLVRSEKRGTWFKVGIELETGGAGKLSHHYVRPAPPPTMIGRS